MNLLHFSTMKQILVDFSHILKASYYLSTHVNKTLSPLNNDSLKN